MTNNDLNVMDLSIISPIYQSLLRMRRICNKYDVIIVSVSGGKDSTVSFELLKKELQIRKSKMLGDGLFRDYDIPYGDDLFLLEEINNKMPFVIVNIQDPEVIYSFTRTYQQDLCLKNSYGVFKSLKDDSIILGNEPMQIDGFDCLYQAYVHLKLPSDIQVIVEPAYVPMNIFYKCLPLSYSSITSGIYISWDFEADYEFIYEIPDKCRIGAEAYKDGDMFINSIPPSLFREDLFKTKPIDGVYPNFGISSTGLKRKIFDFKKRTSLWTFYGQDCESGTLSEADYFAIWVAESLKPNSTICNLVSIRSQESFDRYRTLKNVDVGMPMYSKIKEERIKGENNG